MQEKATYLISLHEWMVEWETNIAKSYKRSEVVESYDDPCPEWMQYIEEKEKDL